MLSLLIVYDVDGWAFHHRARALQKHAPADFDVRIVGDTTPDGRRPAEALLGDAPVDIVFCLTGGSVAPIRALLDRRSWPTRLVGAWSNGWPLRVDRLAALYRELDLLVLNNRDLWERFGRRPGTRALPNGVDLDVFRLTRPIAGRTPKVLWTGSAAKQALKGYEDYIVPLAAALRERGIPCEPLLVDSRGPDRRTPDEMRAWYNSGTVLVCASGAEGTANPALEAAACGCTVVSTATGNMPDLIRDDVNGYLVERDFDALVRAVEAAAANHVRLASRMQEDIRAWSWGEVARGYFDTFRSVTAVGRKAPDRPRDLADEVTVFVTTVGAPTFEACLERLCRQDCTFTLELIENVAPLSAALRRMQTSCRTPFYVQVDEDMLLEPQAIRRLYDGMVAAGPRTAVLGGSLHDEHLGRAVRGVKIFRREVVSRYRIRRDTDWIAMLRSGLARDGYAEAWLDADEPGETLGLHGTAWTPESIYERYAGLARRLRAGAPGTTWFAPYPGMFLQRFLEDRSELNYFALMGALAGTLLVDATDSREKDFREYHRLPGFRRARELFDELARGGGVTGE